MLAMKINRVKCSHPIERLDHTDRSASRLGENRVIIVVVSPAAHVRPGIPNGSMLATILLLSYITDLAECTQSTTMMLFADDRLVNRSINTLNDNELLQMDLHYLRRWGNG